MRTLLTLSSVTACHRWLFLHHASFILAWLSFCFFRIEWTIAAEADACTELPPLEDFSENFCKTVAASCLAAGVSGNIFVSTTPATFSIWSSACGCNQWITPAKCSYDGGSSGILPIRYAMALNEGTWNVKLTGSFCKENDSNFIGQGFAGQCQTATMPFFVGANGKSVCCKRPNGNLICQSIDTTERACPCIATAAAGEGCNTNPTPRPNAPPRPPTPSPSVEQKCTPKCPTSEVDSGVCKRSVADCNGPSVARQNWGVPLIAEDTRQGSRCPPSLPICCAKGVRKTSDRGKYLIKQEEGKCNHVYLDVKCIQTIGIGLTEAKYLVKDVLTDAEVEQTYIQALTEREVNLSDRFSVPVTQCQWDALICLFFNFEKSRKVYRLLNRKKYDEAGLEIEAGRWSPVLQLRRERESRLFLTGRYRAMAQIPEICPCCRVQKCPNCLPKHEVCRARPTRSPTKFPTKRPAGASG